MWDILKKIFCMRLYSHNSKIISKNSINLSSNALPLLPLQSLSAHILCWDALLPAFAETIDPMKAGRKNYGAANISRPLL